MAVQVIPWQMKDADGNLLSPNTYTNTIYDPDGNNVTGLATEREIGNAYDSSKTYPTYSPYCIHNNKFYKYSGASGTTTTGAWDSTKWTETPIANELSLLNQSLTELEVFSKTYSDTTATWTNVLQDFYNSLTASSGYTNLTASQKMSLKVAVNNDIYDVTYNDGTAMIIGCVQNNGSGTIINRTMYISASTRNYSRITITTAGAIAHNNYTTQAIGSAQTIKVLR